MRTKVLKTIIYCEPQKRCKCSRIIKIYRANFNDVLKEFWNTLNLKTCSNPRVRATYLYDKNPNP